PVDVHQDVGIEVNWVDKTMIREALGQGRDGLADLLDPFAEVLAAVPGDEDGRHLRPVGADEQAEFLFEATAHRRIRGLRRHLEAQRVDNRITRDQDALRRYRLAQEGGASRFGWREVE